MVFMRPEGSAKELERRRKRAMALYEEGHSQAEVARMVGSSESSVHRWRKMARRKNGLAAKPHPGRPRVLTPAQHRRLERPPPELRAARHDTPAAETEIRAQPARTSGRPPGLVHPTHQASIASVRASTGYAGINRRGSSTSRKGLGSSRIAAVLHSTTVCCSNIPARNQRATRSSLAPVPGTLGTASSPFERAARHLDLHGPGEAPPRALRDDHEGRSRRASARTARTDAPSADASSRTSPPARARSPR